MTQLDSYPHRRQRYAEEMAVGEKAFLDGEEMNTNPHVFKSMEWYAWRAGWLKAEHERNAECSP